MRRFTTLSLVGGLAAGVFLLGCPAPDAPGADAAAEDRTTEAEHRERAEAAWERYEAAARAEDAEAMAADYTEDVWIRGVGPAFESLRGRDAYSETVEGLFADYAIDRLDVDVEDVIVLGGHVWEAGTFEEDIRVKESGEVITLRGSYISLWREGDAGEWRIHRFMWNEQPPGG